MELSGPISLLPGVALRAVPQAAHAGDETNEIWLSLLVNRAAAGKNTGEIVVAQRFVARATDRSKPISDCFGYITKSWAIRFFKAASTSSKLGPTKVPDPTCMGWQQHATPH